VVWSISESDLKRIEETASCAISIHSSFLTIRDFAPMLLGINRGHLEESTEILKEINGQFSKHPYLRSVTNMAISQVVPVWHIFEMLEGKIFKKQREKADIKLESRAKIIPDEQLEVLFDIPAEKKKVLRANGSIKMSDIDEDRKTHGFMRSTLKSQNRSSNTERRGRKLRHKPESQKTLCRQRGQLLLRERDRISCGGIVGDCCRSLAAELDSFVLFA
jgi:hypothetical protein